MNQPQQTVQKGMSQNHFTYWAQPTCFDLSSSNFNLQGNWALCTGGVTTTINIPCRMDGMWTGNTFSLYSCPVANHKLYLVTKVDSFGVHPQYNRLPMDGWCTGGCWFHSGPEGRGPVQYTQKYFHPLSHKRVLWQGVVGGQRTGQIAYSHQVRSIKHKNILAGGAINKLLEDGNSWL